jgi:hypothetical protein
VDGKKSSQFCRLISEEFIRVKFSRQIVTLVIFLICSDSAMMALSKQGNSIAMVRLERVALDD